MSQPLLLVNKADFEPYVALSSNMDAVKKINMHIMQAQSFDLRPLLGDLLFYDILKKVGDLNTETGGDLLEEDGDPFQVTVVPNPDYSELLNGTTYQVDGVPISFEGLKPVIVHFATARLVPNLSIALSPTGTVRKLNEYSEPVDTRVITMQIKQYENLALGYWHQVKDYLDQNASRYPLWRPGNCGAPGISSGRKGARIYGLNNNS